MAIVLIAFLSFGALLFDSTRIPSL